MEQIAENQKMTGYEVAKKLGVSRSNVDAALQTLLDKGMLLSSVEDVTHFHAISIDEIQGKIQKPWIPHPALTKLLLNNFFHDVVIHEIMCDMKDELEARYGRNFEEIHRKYKGKGWGESAN
ncbi:helix-turn-helix domain-containing protein [Paenibacillus elgii]|uniref:helix-turn-helix domain-containing protein n=1 Tax=Paenibacillus elgii TaxID=189691 RepID=UPI000248DBAE|nr:helix-turn-helix domain-containing protein [Paenibacillus elgii]